LVKRDRVLLGMERTDPEDRQTWRGRLRQRLGSQAAPSAEFRPVQINSDDDDDDDDCELHGVLKSKKGSHFVISSIKLPILIIFGSSILNKFATKQRERFHLIWIESLQGFVKLKHIFA